MLPQIPSELELDKILSEMLARDVNVRALDRALD